MKKLNDLFTAFLTKAGDGAVEKASGWKTVGQKRAS